MGNQQGKTTNMVIWLAGITDGDGCIGLHRQSENKRRKGSSVTYVPSFSISTTCQKTYEYLDELFKQIGIGVYWKRRVEHNVKWKDRWVLEIRGMKRVGEVLELIKEYLVTKKREAYLVLEFINNRLSVGPQTPYSENDISIIKKVCEIKDTRNGNIRRIPREHTPNFSDNGKKICSELIGNYERQAEMTCPS